MKEIFSVNQIGYELQIDSKKSILLTSYGEKFVFYKIDNNKVSKLGAEENEKFVYNLFMPWYFPENRKYVNYRGKNTFQFMIFPDTEVIMLGNIDDNGMIDEWIFVDQFGNEIVSFAYQYKSIEDYNWTMGLSAFIEGRVRIGDDKYTEVVIENKGINLKFVNRYNYEYHKCEMYVYIENQNEILELGCADLAEVFRTIYINLCILKDKKYIFPTDFGKGKILFTTYIPLAIIGMVKIAEESYKLFYEKLDIDRKPVPVYLMDISEQNLKELMYGIIKLLCI